MIRIGGGSGYWGDADMALPQLLHEGNIDYIAFDYLAEITMSILARARARNPELGYATDFVTQVVSPNLVAIAESGTKLLANAGGVNPLACARELERLISEAGLSLRVATITGDDLLDHAGDYAGAREMFSGEPFPERESLASINAYIGAFPIAQALDRGADIIITGRCVDSALTLGACIHAYGWKPGDWDLLAAGSLAGHLIECGNQVAGGNFTDWQRVADTLADAGYPIIEIASDGSMALTKPAGTGGEVSFGTTAEQLLYEIGDPANYILPDVICDFSQVRIKETGKDRVHIEGARGNPAPASYKASATFEDGYRIITTWYFIGREAKSKALAFAEAALVRTRRKLERLNLPDFSETCIDPFGAGTHFSGDAPENASREVTLRLCARHPDPQALSLLLKEASGLALATPPGMALFTGGRPSPSPVIRLFSFLVDKRDVGIDVVMADGRHAHDIQPAVEPETSAPVPEPTGISTGGTMQSVTLREIAWARSGDKGNKANIGVIARDPAMLPYIWNALDGKTLRNIFGHFLEGDIERFYLPGTASMNILLHDVLGGGGIASLRVDTQAKSYAEILLDTPISIPADLG